MLSRWAPVRGIATSWEPDQLEGISVQHFARTFSRVWDHELVCATLFSANVPGRVTANPYDIGRQQDTGAGKELSVSRAPLK